MQILQKSSYVVTAGSDSSSRNTSVLAHHTFFPKAKQSARNCSSTNATHIFVGVPNIFHVHTFVDFNPLETVVS